MKKFSEFINEAKVSLAQFNAKRLGLVSNGHGDWYNEKGEFTAKSKEVNGNKVVLKFYDKPQILGKRDPKQNRTIPSNLVPKSHQTAEQYEKDLREKYILGEIFKEGDWVENLNTGLVGKIIRRGTNYLICVTEDNTMFKPWIKDVVEWTNKSGVPATQREVGTDALRKYVMSLTNTNKIDNFNVKKFINKYKVKRT